MYSLTPDQYKYLSHELVRPVTRVNHEKMFGILDKNDSGAVDYAEFMAIM